MSPARRNLLVAVGTAVVIAVLLLYPTSTNRTGPHRRPGVPVAPVGIQSAAPSNVVAP